MKLGIHNLLIIGVLCLVGCHKKEARPTPEFPVRVGKSFQRDVPYNIKAVGKLVASLEAEMKAQVEGILTAVLFEDGQQVEEGQLLITIDPRIYEAQLQEAKGQLAEDKARLSYALDFAETYGLLVGEEFVSRLDYQQGVQNVDVSKASIEQAEAAVKKAAVNLGYTQIRAPFKGYVGLREYDPGNFIEPSFNKTLVTVRKVVPINVTFYVAGEYVSEIRERQAEEPLYLEATIPNDPSHPLQGVLYFIDNTVNAQTGLITLQGTIPNLDERGWPGEFVRVNLRLKMLRDAILVPQNAPVLTQTGYIVYVLDEKTMTVQMRMVGRGITYQGNTVIEWGLKPGETVITDGQLNLNDGTKVFIPQKKDATKT